MKSVITELSDERYRRKDEMEELHIISKTGFDDLEGQIEAEGEEAEEHDALIKNKIEETFEDMTREMSDQVENRENYEKVNTS